MQLELVGEQSHRGVVELQEPVPLEDAGSPEGHGERKAQNELDERRLGDKSHPVTGPVHENGRGTEPDAFAAMQSVLGPVSTVNGLLSQRRSTVRVIETGEAIPMKTPDQVIVAAEFVSGVPLAFQLRGGLPCGTRLMWEISGSEGDLRISAKVEEIPVINISPLRVEGGSAGERGFSEIEVPSSYYFGLDDAPVARTWRASTA